MPARGPFLARAPLRSLSPVFGRLEAGHPAFVEATDQANGRRRAPSARSGSSSFVAGRPGERPGPAACPMAKQFGAEQQVTNGGAKPAVIRARSAVQEAQPEAEAKERNQLALPWAACFLARSSLGACGRTTRQSGGVASAVRWSLGEAASGAVEQGDEADEASAGATAGRRRRRMPAPSHF